MPSNRHLSRAFFLITLLTMAALADAVEEDFSRLKAYGLLASAAYEGEAKARAACEAQGYEFSQYGTASGVEVAYFLGTNHQTRTHIVAIRGTANAENVMVDANFKLMKDELTGNMLHSGFAQAATEVYRRIQPKLQRDYTIQTTGHSLGGAVAMVLAMYLDQEGYKLGKVVTFGQPKVTNIIGATRYASMDITRVVTQKDVVPLVPPFDPLDIKNVDIYWHAGEELILLQGPEYSLASGISSMLRTVQFFKEMPGEHNLQHHMMSLYLELLDKKIEQHKKVPYKTGLDLYDLL